MNIKELKVGSQASLPVFSGNSRPSIVPVTVLWIHPEYRFIHVALNNSGFMESIPVNQMTGRVG